MPNEICILLKLDYFMNTIFILLSYYSYAKFIKRDTCADGMLKNQKATLA